MIVEQIYLNMQGWMKMGWFIKTERGYFKDLITPSFVPKTKDALLFKNLFEAKQYVKALKEMEGIHAVLEEDNFANDPELNLLLDLARKVVQEAEANAAENPTADKIQVVIVEPGKAPYKKMIKNDIDTFHKIVDGYIENVFIGKTAKDARVGIVLNEEGKLIGLPFNRRIFKNGVTDDFVGNIFITAYNWEGDNVSLSDAEADHYIQRFQYQEVYF